MSTPADAGAPASGAPTARPAGGARLTLARHGLTDHNVEGRMQGRTDIPLNATGREQARALARAIAAGAPPHVIVSSPLQRALATAQTVGDAVGVPVRTDPAFVERGFGVWEGLTGEEIRAGWPDEHRAWRERRTVAGLGMESRTEVARRVGETCRRLVDEHPGQRILVVAHGAAITLGITALIGVDPEEFRGIAGLENCHRSTLDPLAADPAGRLMRLVSHNLAPDFPD